MAESEAKLETRLQGAEKESKPRHEQQNGQVESPGDKVVPLSDFATLYIKQVNDIVTILVGEDKTVFKVHTHQLGRVSPYLKAALSDRWKSGNDSSLTFDHVQPFVFALFVDWAQSGSFMSMHFSDVNLELGIDAFCMLYILAEEIQALALQNEVIEQIFPLRDQITTLPLDVLGSVFSLLPSSSMLRKLVVQCWIKDAGKEDLTQPLRDQVRGLVEDLAEAALESCGDSELYVEDFMVEISDRSSHRSQWKKRKSRAS
ncbi:Hypothetical protein D9617_8g050660 [Elsinoe fawcettii]|nr:Hypothetical protein D9617_8g050660 [Elsinoe fawcettii]